jgi:WS/DGAT/MGAT family acyltransferase
MTAPHEHDAPQRPFFERLHARDACFLSFERADLHMHVGATAIFEAGSLRTPSGDLDIERIRSYMSSRLPLNPRCTQRIARVPVLRAPVWIDDHSFDITNHVQLARVADPGGVAELQALAGELISRPLDRSRPLWEVWFIDGLANPHQFGVVVKFHHCMADGLAAIEFTRRFLATEPLQTFDEPQPLRLRPAPSGATLLRHELGRVVRFPAVAAQTFARLGRERDARQSLAAKLRAMIDTIWIGLRPTSNTGINRRVGPARRFDWAVIDLKDIRQLRKRYGGSLNEVSLGLVSGAMVRIFTDRGDRPPKLRAMAPTSALSRDELQSSLGNRVYAPLIDLPLRTTDLDERMRRIQRGAQARARTRQGLGWDAMSDLASWTGVRTQQLFMWLSAHLRTYNVILTLVPGPHTPLYLLDAKMVEVYPVLPLLDRQTMTLGVMRYTGKLYWGTVYTPEYLEAFPLFIPRLQASLAELLAEVEAETPATAEDAPAAFMTEPA